MQNRRCSLRHDVVMDGDLQFAFEHIFSAFTRQKENAIRNSCRGLERNVPEVFRPSLPARARERRIILRCYFSNVIIIIYVDRKRLARKSQKHQVSRSNIFVSYFIGNRPPLPRHF